MNYQQFVTTLKEITSVLLGESITIQTKTVLKNNGTSRTGLMITQPNVNISPTIYLEQFYDDFNNGRTLSDISKQILSLYEHVKSEESWELPELYAFEDAQKRIACKLIHHEKNLDLLKRIPHIPYLDLEIVFYILLDSCNNGIATVLITDEILNHWGIPLELLYQIAFSNMPTLLEADCKPMYEFVTELLGHAPEADIEYDSCLHVLTNTNRHFGASCILYPNVLEDIANQLGDDYYLLPSSIHEFIILPARHALSQDELAEMIIEINTTQLLDEEILSDHAYYYSRKEKAIVMA